jgi:hypothetical protein
MELTGRADDGDERPRAENRSLSPALAEFLADWQPRQRKTAGYQAMLFNRLDALARAHPEWDDYDLLTHALGALHLIIENDRLTGGHTREQIVDELAGLVALEYPGDSPARHHEIVAAIVDLLLNARGRHTRLSHPYMRVGREGAVDHPPLTLRLVQTVGDEDATTPILRPTPEAINIFQNLFEFDPSDRAAAERYRSERMLQRRDYDEVLSSVERRSTSIHGLRADLERMLRRISYNVGAGCREQVHLRLSLAGPASSRQARLCRHHLRWRGCRRSPPQRPPRTVVNPRHRANCVRVRR